MTLKWRRRVLLLFMSGIIVVLLVALYTTVFQLPTDCDDLIREKDHQIQLLLDDSKKAAHLEKGDDPSWGPHKLCLLVPFRDRFDELEEFVPHMHEFLNKKSIRHKIMVLNQHDILRFNRASLINAGFKLAENDCDYIAMHDVDLLPLNPELSYVYPEKGPFHVASPNLHPKYHYKKFVGGILILTNEQFRKTNGLSNIFWGWGREDDEFYLRMVSADLQIYRPGNISTNETNTFKHIHDKEIRRRDYNVYGEQQRASRRRDHMTGLNTVQYEVLSQRSLVISGAPCTVYDIQLYCDVSETPWCVHPHQLDSIMQDTANANAAAQKKVQKAEDKIRSVHHDINEAQKALAGARVKMRQVHEDPKPANENVAPA